MKLNLDQRPFWTNLEDAPYVEIVVGDLDVCCDRSPLAVCQTITTTRWNPIVPSTALPQELEIQDGNNNLDVAFFQGRYYFLSFGTFTDLVGGIYWLLNYSSNIHGPQKNWIRGQLGKTNIYETELQIGSCSLNNQKLDDAFSVAIRRL